MNFKAIIFDIDGTLADTLPLCYSALIETIYHYSNKKYSDEEIRKFFGPSEEGIFMKMFPDNWEEVLNYYYDYYTENHEKLGKLYPKVPLMLAKIRKVGILIGIVSGKGSKTAKISLDKMGIIDLVDCIKTGKPFGPSKPEAIKDVLKEFKVDAKEAGYVGDISYDMLASKEVGTYSIGAAWASTGKKEKLAEAGAEIIFESLDDFQNWLLEKK